MSYWATLPTIKTNLRLHQLRGATAALPAANLPPALILPPHPAQFEFLTSR